MHKKMALLAIGCMCLLAALQGALPAFKTITFFSALSLIYKNLPICMVLGYRPFLQSTFWFYLYFKMINRALQVQTDKPTDLLHASVTHA